MSEPHFPTVGSVKLVPISVTDSHSVVDEVIVEFAGFLKGQRGLSSVNALSAARLECDREIAEMKNSKNSGIYVVMHEGLGNVGHIWIAQRNIPEPNTWHILYIAISPTYRRRGLAASGLQCVLDAARRQGVDVITLNVSSTNVPALALYRSLGFKPYSRGWVKRINR
ncbi:GNAT family N-acetyltransferase [Nocardia rhamnosiphila]|uniref:GNAT family N-acetyltransferase n=1 Tax=Nocardia rhamnosiphila TaxID=426716 RepID=UPI0033E0733F